MNFILKYLLYLKMFTLFKKKMTDHSDEIKELQRLRNISMSKFNNIKNKKTKTNTDKLHLNIIKKNIKNIDKKVDKLEEEDFISFRDSVLKNRRFSAKKIPLIKATKVKKTDKIYKYSNPKQVQKMASKYIKGLKVYRSNKKDKKYMVLDPKKNKWIHFGQIPYEDFTKHKDLKRRKNYLTRTASMKGNWKSNKYSANNLARKLLW